MSDDMNTKFKIKDTITIGLMLFALFFGAGNLVFPAMLGQSAGVHFWQANLGFLITGVGLPLLGTIAFGFSGSKNLLELTSRVHPWFGLAYTTLLYLSIGPLFALPRTGSVSFEIGIIPFIETSSEQLLLAVYTVIFFGISLLFSLNPARIIDIVGKILTPVLIFFIAIITIISIVIPLGQPQAAISDFGTNAFFIGFQEGYLTMDTLAAFVFSIIVIDAIKAKGATKRGSILKVSFQASLVSAAILAIIYSSLTYIGATSVEQFGHLDNGGEVLNLTSNYYFGTYGSIILGVIVLLACLTTSIGLISSCSSYFTQLFPKLGYKPICIIISAVSALIANVGLARLIDFSVPVLTILYPLAIVLIALTFLHNTFRGNRFVYILSLLLTFIISFIYGASGTPLQIGPIDAWMNAKLPLYNLGLGWLIPAVFGAVLGSVFPHLSNNKTA